MAEKLKFREALLKVASNAADLDNKEAKKLADALDNNQIKPAALDQLAEAVARFLPKFRSNTNVASIDWTPFLPLLEKAIEIIAHKLGL